MPLFTSNSKLREPISILLFTLIILTLYATLLPFLKVQPQAFQSQYQENLAKSEMFLFSDKSCSTLILGSSLSSLLEERFLSPGICNLALGGGSALTSLEIALLKENSNVRHLIVEMNVLKDIDSELLSTLASPTWSFLKKHFSFLLQENQPVTLLLSFLRMKFPPTSKIITAEQFKVWLDLNKESTSRFSENDRLEYQEKLLRLKSRLTQLKEQGLKITILWLPRHSDLEKSIASLGQLGESKNIFPLTEWSWIHEPLSSLETTDGQHLTENSAKMFSNIIEPLIKKLEK